jgi:hypothetical protein
MYQLRTEKKYVIAWRTLSEITGLLEGVVCDRAIELRENGFFDQRSQEIGVVSLTDKQSDRGHLRAQANLVARLIRESLAWRIVAIIAVVVWALLMWLLSNVAYDVLKWLLSW